jgi:hypothetical protein
VGPDYGNGKQVKWMGQEPHDPRPAEKKSEYRWDEVTRMVSNLGHSRYPVLPPDVTVPAQQLPKHMMSSKNIEALYMALVREWYEMPSQGMRAEGCIGCTPRKLTATETGYPESLGENERVVVRFHLPWIEDTKERMGASACGLVGNV